MSPVTLTAPRSITQWLRLYMLYRTAFPAAEQKPFSMIMRNWRKEKMDIWCLCRDGRFVGLATTMKYANLVLIDYLAVAKKHRGTGVGTAALSALRKRYPEKALFLEIESVYEDAPNIIQRQRRKAFYLRCGLTPMKLMVTLGGVNMEVLGFDCKVTYSQYKEFYQNILGPWADTRVAPKNYPEA